MKTKEEKLDAIITQCVKVLATQPNGLCYEVTEDDGCPWVDAYKINDNTDSKTIERRCGTCEHWMKKPDCPREKGVGGGGGPSRSGIPCEKYTVSSLYQK